MGRKERIARSIAKAITHHNDLKKKTSRNPLAWILAWFSAFFSLHQLLLAKIRAADFANLRRNHWKVTDDDYADSFQPSASESGKPEEALKGIGDMGFSGSVGLPSYIIMPVLHAN